MYVGFILQELLVFLSMVLVLSMAMVNDGGILLAVPGCVPQAKTVSNHVLIAFINILTCKIIHFRSTELALNQRYVVSYNACNHFLFN